MRDHEQKRWRDYATEVLAASERGRLDLWEARAQTLARGVFDLLPEVEQNARLREALGEIAHGEPPDEVWDMNVASSGVEWAGKIARAALSEEPQR